MKIYQSKGRECFFYILRKWPKIIVGAIVIALLFGAYTGFKTGRSWDQKKADVESIRQAREEQVPIYEQNLADFESDIANKEAELDEYREQLNNAMFLRYDEATVGMASAELYFYSFDEEGNPKELPAGLLDAFVTSLKDNIDWESVAESGSADINFLDELFIISANPDTNIVSLKIFSENEQSAINMISAILIEAQPVQANLASRVGDFEYSELSRNSGEDRYGEFIEIKTRIQNHYNEIAIALQGLYDARDELEAPPEAIEMPSTNQVVKSIIKHVVFGGVVGVVAMIAIFYLLFYLNGKLHSADELAYYTGSNTMAYLSAGKKKRSKIYRLIAKKENNGLLYSQKDAVLRTVSNIKTQYPETTKVMFTGINAESEAENLKKALAGAKGMGFMFGIEKNILTDKEAFDHLSYYDAVVLVERVDKTSIELINKEVDQITIAGKEIVGSLLVR